MKSKFGLILLVSTGSLLTVLACTKTNNTYQSISRDTSAPNTGPGPTGDGGGGQGVLCGDKLVLRDIYEAQSLRNLEMKKLPASSLSDNKISDEAIQLLSASLKQYFGPSYYQLEFGKDASYWQKFADKIQPLSSGSFLRLSSDAGSPVDLPSGCSLKQIAFWQDSAGVDNRGILYVNQDMWSKLDDVNKVALLAHEYFYRQARAAHYTSSDFVRGKIGYLFSKNGLPPLFDQWEPSTDPRLKDYLPASEKGFKYCEGRSDDEPEAELQFYQYEGADHKQHVVVPLISSSQMNVSQFEKVHFSFDPKNEQTDTATKMFIYFSDLMLFTNGYPANGSPLTSQYYLPSIDFGNVSNRPYNNEALELQLFDGYFLGELGDIGYGFAKISEQNSNGLPILGGLISKLPAVKKVLNLEANSLALTPEILKSQIQTGDRGNPVSISLLNPYRESQRPDNFSKDANGYASEFMSIIESQLSSSPLTLDGNDPVTKVPVIDVLKNEIQEKMTSENCPGKICFFPKWQQKIKALITAIDDDPNGPSISKYMDSRVTGELPTLIYHAKMGDLDFDKAASVLNDFRNPVPSFYPGRIKISESHSDLTFKLNCHNFNSVFAQVADAGQKNLLADTSKFQIRPDLQFNYKNRKRNQNPNFLNATDKMISLLKTPDVGERVLSIGKFLGSADSPNSFYHEGNSLLRNLSTASQLELITCYGLPFMRSQYSAGDTGDDGQRIEHTCSFFHFPESNDIYLVVYSLLSPTPQKLDFNNMVFIDSLRLDYVRHIYETEFIKGD